MVASSTAASTTAASIQTRPFLGCGRPDHGVVFGRGTVYWDVVKQSVLGRGRLVITRQYWDVVNGEYWDVAGWFLVLEMMLGRAVLETL